MRKKYQKFILRLTILTLVLGIAGYILGRLLPAGMILPSLPYLMFLFFVITALVHYVLLRLTRLNPGKYVGYFMMATFLKMMVYLLVIVIYVFYVKKGIVPFILSFFILYIIYTVFEVVTILAQTKE